MTPKPWPYDADKEPTPAEWGFNMTICIAALCNAGDGIVTASDHMLSTEDFSADDMALKMESISKNWKAMFAAEDLSYIVPVLDGTQKTLGSYLSEYDLDDVATAMQTSFLKERKKKTEVGILSPLGFTVESFASTGLKKLGAPLFRQLAQEIREVRLDVEFLVYGFDRNGDGHIFSIRDPGEIKYRDRSGLWAIGTGKYRALSSLFFHSCSFLMPAELMVYHVCEAKFMCKGAPGVGDHTFVTLLRHNHTEKYFFPQELEAIREAWESKGKPRIPDGITQQISEMIQEPKQSASGTLVPGR